MSKLQAMTEGGADDMGSMTREQLQARLKERGLSQAGKKAELVERLKAAAASEKAEVSKEDSVEVADTMASGDLEKLPVAELKSRLKKLGLRVSGKKAELVARLKVASEARASEKDEEDDEEEDLSSLKLADLKSRLRALGKKTTGTKAVLIERLREGATADEDEDLESLTMPVLRSRLKELGLSTHGKRKAELVERLAKASSEVEALAAKEKEAVVDEDEEAEDASSPKTASRRAPPATGARSGSSGKASSGSGWLKKGADVDVKYENNWHTCKILDVSDDGEFLRVMYYDGEDEEDEVEVETRVRELQPTWVEKGMKVDVEADGAFYEAKVLEISSDWKNCKVTYTDGGDVEEDVNIRSRVRELQLPWIEKDMQVEIEYEGEWFPGKVLKVSKDREICTVMYDGEDEEQEEDVEVRSRVRPPRRRAEDLKIGEKITGRVTKTVEFGAFVDIGAERDGLVHISALAEKEPDATEDIVQEGEEVDVWVRYVNDQGKIALTMVESMARRLPRQPYMEDLTPFVNMGPNERVRGTVKLIKDFGFFVEVEPPGGGRHARGLVHVTEITDRFVSHPGDYVEEGEEVELRVINVELDTRPQRLSLSMKDA